MIPAGFELVIPASDRPQTLALDRSATGTGKTTKLTKKKLYTGMFVLIRKQYFVHFCGYSAIIVVRMNY